MKGYVRNKTTMWTHAMKRAIGPGSTVSLKELYKQYGKKHNLAKGDEFVAWLRTVKLKDTERWEVVLETEEKKDAKTKKAKKAEAEAPAPEPKLEPTIKQMTVEDIVELSVRKAREVLPKITDLKLLKYALEEAGPRAGKDSLIRLLRKRVQELNLAR